MKRFSMYTDPPKVGDLIQLFPGKQNTDSFLALMPAVTFSGQNVLQKTAGLSGLNSDTKILGLVLHVDSTSSTSIWARRCKVLWDEKIFEIYDNLYYERL